jgi:hypothetical protein
MVRRCFPAITSMAKIVGSSPIAVATKFLSQNRFRYGMIDGVFFLIIAHYIS